MEKWGADDLGEEWDIDVDHLEEDEFGNDNVMEDLVSDGSGEEAALGIDNDLLQRFGDVTINKEGKGGNKNEYELNKKKGGAGRYTGYCLICHMVLNGGDFCSSKSFILICGAGASGEHNEWNPTTCGLPIRDHKSFWHQEREHTNICLGCRDEIEDDLQNRVHLIEFGTDSECSDEDIVASTENKDMPSPSGIVNKKMEGVIQPLSVVAKKTTNGSTEGTKGNMFQETNMEQPQGAARTNKPRRRKKKGNRSSGRGGDSGVEGVASLTLLGHGEASVTEGVKWMTEGVVEMELNPHNQESSFKMNCSDTAHISDCYSGLDGLPLVPTPYSEEDGESSSVKTTISSDCAAYDSVVQQQPDATKQKKGGADGKGEQSRSIG